MLGLVVAAVQDHATTSSRVSDVRTAAEWMTSYNQ